MKYCVALVSLVCVITLAAMEAEAMPPIPCNPRFMDEMPVRVRKVCNLLHTLKVFDNTIDDYGNQQAVEGLPLFGSGVKRQDVDHVFLRFG